MPKVKLAEDKHGPLRVMLYGYMGAETLDEAAAKTGIATSTFRRRLKDPGTMKLSELLAFGRRYHIPIEDLRQAIRY